MPCRLTINRFGLALIGTALQAASIAGPAIDQGASVPPDLLQRPGADTCPALRSGTYRLITPTLGGTLADQTGSAELDAVNLTLVRADGGRGEWEAKGNCRFAEVGANGYGVDYVVSPAGVLVGRVTVNGGSSFRNVLGIPEQMHRLSELAGTWNTIGLRSGGAAMYADASSFTYGIAGTVTAGTECANSATWATDLCVELPASVLADLKPFVPDPGGGFVSRNGARTTRLFLYRGATGQPLLVTIDNDGAFRLGTPAETLSAPTVGRFTVSWNLDMTGQLASATSTYVANSSVIAVDQAQRSWTRTKNQGLPDEHPEILFYNSPRKGYVTRPAGEARTPSGSTLRFNEFTFLVLPGSGLVGLILPKIKLFEFSVYQP